MDGKIKKPSVLLESFSLVAQLKSFTTHNFVKAVWTGLEPATPCVTGMYSNQLNYQTGLAIANIHPLTENPNILFEKETG